MKIAVLLFGHLRDYKNSLPTLKEFILDKYDCDAFIHTWDTLDHNSDTWHDKKQKGDVDTQVLAFINKMIKPKKILVEKQVPIESQKIESIKTKRSWDSCISHYIFESMLKSYSLMESYKNKNKIYDLVLVSRCDVSYNTTLDLQDILNQAKLLNLDISKHRFYACEDFKSNSTTQFHLLGSDILFFGTQEVIKKYIDANKDIPLTYSQSHAINNEFIFASREIEAGIIPIPISYKLPNDFTIFSMRNISKKADGTFTNEKKSKKLVKILLKPLIKLFKKHPSLLD